MTASKLDGSLPAMRRSNSALQLRLGLGEAAFPVGARLDAGLAGGAPGVEDVGRNLEGRRVPVEELARAGDFVGAERRAVRLVGAGLGRRAEADGRLAGDHRRLVGMAGRLDGVGDRFGIVAVDVAGVPAGGLEAGDLVGVVGQRDRAVDRDVVVVPEDDQLVELEMAGKRDGFLGNAFHQAAVAGQHIGVVVDEVVAEGGVHDALAEREADRIGEALAERAGRRLDAGGMAVFGMAGGLRAQLAEMLDLVDGHVLVAGQIEQRIEQHRAVAGRQDEAVAVGPVRGLRDRISGSGVNSTVAMSAQPIGRPGWPELAFSTASMERKRIALAIRSCCSRDVMVPPEMGVWGLGRALEKGARHIAGAGF